MASFFEDPLRQALRKHVGRVHLGSSSESAGQDFDRSLFIQDLTRAGERNTQRFYLLVTILVLGFAGVLLFAFVNPSGVKPELLLGGTGVFTGGIGSILLKVASSWWRTDTLLTMAKYANLETLDLIIRELLAGDARRKSSSGTRRVGSKPSK